jgi:sulfur carrier protein
MKLFGIFRRFVPNGKEKAGFEMELKEGSIIADILQQLEIPEEEPKILVRNHRVAHEEDRLVDGDIVALFPPVGGG